MIGDFASGAFLLGLLFGVLIAANWRDFFEAIR